MKLNEESSDFVYLGKRIDKALDYIQNSKTDLLDWFKQYVEIPYQDIMSGELDLEEEDYTFDYLDSLLDDLEKKFNVIFETKNKMTQEQLRMQFLSGVITESEYKVKLEEFDMDQFSFGNSSSPKASFEDKWNDVPNANKEILKKSTGKEPVKIMASSKGANYVITKGSDGKFYRYQYTQAENPGKPMGPFSSEEEAKKLNESLNEHYIAGGIVGVGAINNPFEGRKKESYEDAFEYFLSQKYNLKEIEKYEGDLPKNDLKKLEGELKSAGHDAKLSGINLDFILVKTPNKGELQVVTNDEGQYVVQPRNASNIKDKVEFGPTTKSSTGEKEDNLATGIKYVVNYFDKLK